MRALFYYLRIKFWETITCKYSDKFITLNQRDSQLLKKYYNKQSTIQLPTSFVDKFNVIKAKETILNTKEEITYLFVGVSFFPNIEGVQWLLDNVMPYVDGVLYVIGKGMDHVQFNNLNERVKILGFVDDLSEYYYHAKCVVSPIFSGAGMKTKTAEALMYGKTIIGTTEAFEGYDIDNHCMFCCNTKEEFIDTMNALNSREPQYINNASRELFEEKYSISSSLKTARLLFDKTYYND